MVIRFKNRLSPVRTTASPDPAQALPAKHDFEPGLLVKQLPRFCFSEVDFSASFFVVPK